MRPTDDDQECAVAAVACGRTDRRRLVAPAEVFRVPRKDDFVSSVVLKVTPDPHALLHHHHHHHHRHEAARPALRGGRRPLGRRLPGPVFQGPFQPLQRRLESLQLLERRQPIRGRRHTGAHFGLFSGVFRKALKRWRREMFRFKS